MRFSRSVCICFCFFPTAASPTRQREDYSRARSFITCKTRTSQARNATLFGELFKLPKVFFFRTECFFASSRVFAIARFSPSRFTRARFFVCFILFLSRNAFQPLCLLRRSCIHSLQTPMFFSLHKKKKQKIKKRMLYGEICCARDALINFLFAFYVLLILILISPRRKLLNLHFVPLRALLVNYSHSLCFICLSFRDDAERNLGARARSR